MLNLNAKERKFKKDLVPKPRWDGPFKPPALPLMIEIGCGVGLHPIKYASANPNNYLVAIEHTKEKFDKFYRRFQNHDIQNLLPIHANAIGWVAHFVQPESVDKYFFLFPNPNPKKSDLAKRWHAMPFMEFVISTLKPGGTIQFATNEKFYNDECLYFMTTVWGLELVTSVELKNGDGEARTHFEIKYLERNETIYDLVFRKN